MRPFPTGLLLALALLPSVAGAADATAGAEAAVSDPAEYQAFKDTLERYRARSNEFLADVAAEVDAHEQAQRGTLQAGFLKLQASLEEQENLYRKQGESRIEAFLAKYPASPHTADMKFRLADLYFEDAELQFFAAEEEYGRLEEQAEQNPALELPPPPAKDYARSIAIYREIIAEHQDYANLADTYYMLAWSLGAINAAQYDVEAARAEYEVITERFPKTPFSNDANMWLGEYWFDKPGTREAPTVNIPTAIARYETVLADGPSGRNYDEAIYKLGWSHYKLNDYDRALAYLVQLLDYSEDQFTRTGKVSNMRPEAIEYLAISYADLADRQGKAPVAVAQGHFQRIGEKKWEHDVIERLAEILRTQAKYEEAIATFTFLQDRWPLHPRNPEYQNRIAITWGTMPIPEPGKAAAALAQLSERYGEGSPWYQANKGDPDAIATARGFIETSLAAVAVEYLARARETNSLDDYRSAAKKFDDFLNSFPLANDYDLYEWYRALSYFGSKQWPQAEAAYAQILKNDRSPYRDGSRFQIMKVREAVVLQKYGALDARPDDAKVEKVVTTAAGKEVTRYVISDEQKAFMEVADDLVTREFAPGEWAKALEDDRPALAYIPGQILYSHGHYDEARQRFDKLIALFPRSDYAVYATSLYVNALAAEGDLEGLEAATTRFLAMDLGKNPDLHKVNLSEMTDIREQAAFGLALKYIEAEDRAGAAKAFTKFLEEYPNSKFYKEALFNAGKSYSQAGNAAEAIRRFEQYVSRYPTDPQSQFLYTEIAQNYSATLDLNRAIQNYDTLAKLFPTSPDAPAAVYNAAFLRVGLGDHAAAARGFEQYGAQFPDQGDAEDAYFRAGAQWELVGDSDALAFYGRYLKRYGDANATHAIEAWDHISTLSAKRRDTRKVAEAQAQIQRIFRDAGGEVSEHARGIAAAGALAELVSAFERFKVVKWSTSEAKNVEILTKTKADERKAIEQRAIELIATYRDYDTAVASLYIQGMSYYAYADLAYAIPPPKGLSDEETDIFRQTVDDQFRLPAEDRGKARLVQSLDKARAEKRWSEWNGKALAELHERYPFEYPSERQESRGVPTSSEFPFGRPLIAVPPPEGGTP